MAQHGIQEPSLLGTRLIQEATHYQNPLQLVSFDMEKACGRVVHHIIVQALRAFGVPEIMIMGIQHYTFVGFGYVEVTGRIGLLITIKTGSGQGDPFSSILFLIDAEPLNCMLTSLFPALMYVKEEGVTVGTVLHVDENLTPLSLRSADELHPILSIYPEYTGVSGLNINIRKTTALCINTPAETYVQLQQLGMSTPGYMKHLGLHLSTTISSSIETSMSEAFQASHLSYPHSSC
jgi:hypothetical protein